MKKLVPILLLLLLCFAPLAMAQQQTNDDVKVGLVLSGGGAKGFAHIGVLKVIDSLGIKIDYIGGTSMGAVVGALYASGYSGKQLDSIFSRLTFNQIVNDEVPRDAKTFYERENSEKHAIALPFEKFKIQLPSGISKGQNIFDLFTKLTFHVKEVTDFKKLPIPFFCITTNVETGKQVILEEGILAEAISASSAFPSLYQPIIINDNVFIDGGVVNNYPIEELKAKGVDVIIGVDVQNELATRDELKSGPDILLQINNYTTTAAMVTKSKMTDIYIKPDIEDFSVISFGEGKQIIENGRLAANESIEQLKKLRTKNYLPQRHIVHPDSIKINTINIIGNKNYTREYILGKLKLKPRSTISYNDFNKGISSIVATDNFDSFIYDFKPNSDGYKLNIKLRENKFRTFLKLGVHFDDLYKSGALVNFTTKRLLFNNDVTSLDLVIGDNLRYNFEYFIDKGFYWSVGVTSRYNEFEKNITPSFLLDEDDINPGLNQLNAELSDQTNRLYFQTLFRKDFALRFGAEHKRLKISSETVLNNIDPDETESIFENSDFISAYGTLKFDTFDDKFFPKKGFLFDGDFHLYLASSDFNNNFSEFSIAKANIRYVKSFFNNKLAVTGGSEGGFKVGEDSNNSLSFALGGYGNNFINNFISFYGYDYIALGGDSFVKALLNIDYEIFKKHHINIAANYANVENDIFETGEWFSLPDFSGYALGYGIETIIGPAEIKWTWSPETKQSEFFFAIGYWF